MIAIRGAFFISGILSIALAGDMPLVREGKYWVEVRSGAEPVAPSAHVRITSRGAVTLNGGAGQ